jgi:ribosomal protein L37AE/L43A
MEMLDTLKPFVFHGADFLSVPKATGKSDKPKGQARGVCPFCDHENKKFYVNVESQLWDCKNCGKKGNLIAFLSEILKSAVAKTTKDHYKELAAIRAGVPAKMLEDDGLGRDERFSEPRWLIPIRDIRGKLVNIMVWQPGKNPMFTAGLPLTLIGLEGFRGPGPVMITEGYWDMKALQRLRKGAGKKASIIAAPSANVFKTEWTPLFVNREVAWMFDNDSAGYEGSRAGAYKLRGHSAGNNILEWPSNTPDGWDIRDFVHTSLDKDKDEPLAAWANLMELISVYENGDDKMSVAMEAKNFPRRKDFAAVLKDFKRIYHIDKRMEEALALMFATVLSVQLHGDPIWLFVVGPPGSGKTMLLRAFEKSPYCIFKSSITPKSLISGFNPGNNLDPSLIPQLRGKVLVLKDYTEIMTQSREIQEEMYGILRGAYDGHAERTYGNGEVRSYPDTYFSMLAGVTDRIHGDERASLGERFLKFQMIEGADYDPTKHIATAITGMVGQKEMDELIREIAAGFTLKHDISGTKPPEAPLWVRERINALAQIIAFLRADVPRIGRDELAYRPTPEVGTRLAKQLIKLAQCLAIVYGSKVVDKKAYALIEKVAFDTARGWSLDIMRVIMMFNPKPTFADIIELKAKIPKTTCHRRLENLVAIGAVNRKRLGKDTGRAGQPAFGYVASETLARLWKDAKIGQAEKGK